MQTFVRKKIKIFSLCISKPFVVHNSGEKERKGEKSMKKLSFFEKPAGSRTVYVLAGVSFCLTAVAVGMFYSQTTKKQTEILTSVPTTYQAGRNQKGESDPRYTTTVYTTTQATTLPVTEKETTTSTPQTKAANVTTQATTEKQSYMLPCDGKVIREYSPKIPIYCETMEDWRTHCGVDFLVEEEGEVLSVGKGKVSKVLIDSVYGYTVEVDYGEFTARYCGMKQGSCVRIDQLLNKGDSIGQVGEVPCESKSGRHLHLEIIRNGDYADPIKVLGN